MPEANEGALLFVSYNYPYVYVFWRQAEPAPDEIAAIHEADPRLKGKDVSQVVSLLKNEECWPIGPLDSAAESDRISSQLRAAGLRVEVKWSH